MEGAIELYSGGSREAACIFCCLTCAVCIWYNLSRSARKLFGPSRGDVNAVSGVFLVVDLELSDIAENSVLSPLLKLGSGTLPSPGMPTPTPNESPACGIYVADIWCSIGV